MARSYKVSQRKRRYRRKPKYGYFGKAGHDARKAIKMAGKALALLNPEHKYVDNLTSGNLSSTASLHLLNGVSEGTTAQTRNGNSIKFESIYARLQFNYNSAGNPNQWLRYIIVRDMQPNGAVFASTDLLDTVTTYGLRNLEKSKRFKVYRDEVIDLTTDSGSGQFREIYIDLKHDGNDDHTEYLSNGSTIASISTNSYYLMALSESATNTPTWVCQTRMRFLDN